MYIRTIASIDINSDFIFYISVDSVIKSLRGLPWLNPAEVCTYVQYFKKAVLNSVPPDFSCIPYVFFTFCCCFCHCYHPINILWFQKLDFPLKAVIINLKICHIKFFHHFWTYFAALSEFFIHRCLLPTNATDTRLSILLIIPLYLSF